MFTENDYQVVRSGGGSVHVFIAEDRTTSSVTTTMKPGEPVKKSAASGNYVIPLATGDPEIGTDEFVGVVFKESTETASADGEVEVFVVQPLRTLLRAKPTTTTNMDTQSELNGLKLDWVAGDVTASTGTNGIFTIDEDETDDADVHGFQIIDGDIRALTLDFQVHSMVCEAGPYVS